MKNVHEVAAMLRGVRLAKIDAAEARADHRLAKATVAKARVELQRRLEEIRFVDPENPLVTEVDAYLRGAR